MISRTQIYKVVAFCLHLRYFFASFQHSAISIRRYFYLGTIAWGCPYIWYLRLYAVAYYGIYIVVERRSGVYLRKLVSYDTATQIVWNIFRNMLRTVKMVVYIYRNYLFVVSYRTFYLFSHPVVFFATPTKIVRRKYGDKYLRILYGIKYFFVKLTILQLVKIIKTAYLSKS